MTQSDTCGGGIAGCDPALLDRDLDREPTLPVGRADQLVDVGDVRLELDDEQRTSARMPGEDVDDAALAVDRERDLGRGDPCRQVAESPGDGLVQSRVTGVEQPIEVAGAPSRR